jgi:hypothetical protein
MSQYYFKMTVGNKAAADDAVVFVSIAQFSEIISHSGHCT